MIKTFLKLQKILKFFILKVFAYYKYFRELVRLLVLKARDCGCGKRTVLTNARTFGKGDVNSNWCFEYQDHQNIPYPENIIFLGYKFSHFLQLLFIKVFLRDIFFTVRYILHSNNSHCQLHHLHVHMCPYLFLELYKWIL